MKKVWQEDVTPLFEATGIKVPKPLKVSFNETTYEYEKDPKANWLYWGFQGFKEEAKSRKSPKTVVSVGVGSGLDGIAMYEVFHPEEIILTDVHPGVIDIAQGNLESYFNRVRARVKYHVRLGNICSPLKPESADIVYANLPTIPGVSDKIFEKMNSSSIFDPNWVKNCPRLFQENYLCLQYEFLRQAMRILIQGGSALVALGVRMPVSVVRQMFICAGYKEFKPLVVDLKEQMQPELILPAYAQAELEYGSSFDFYQKSALDINLNSIMTLEEVKETLRASRVSASEAWKLNLSGHKIYHVVSILRGKKEG